MGVAGAVTMKLVGCCLGLLLCALPQRALAQGSEKSPASAKPVALPEPPSAPGVTSPPQSSEAAPALPSDATARAPSGGDALADSNASTPASTTELTPATAEKRANDRWDDRSAENDKRVWYGWQTLATDLAAVSITYLALKQQGPTDPSAGRAPDHSGPSAGSLLGGLAVATFVFGAPAVHLVHRRLDSAGISLGLRLALPALGGLAGLGLAGGCSANATDCAKSSPVLAIVVGAVVGSITASALDASTLAFEKPKPKARPIAQLGCAPVLSADGKQLGLRVFGTF
jgi:hypothetical protein